jgi:hypothetical protein
MIYIEEGECHEELKVQRMRRNQLSSSFLERAIIRGHQEIMPVAHQEVHALWRWP